MSLEATFEAELWLWSGKDAWHFLTLPEDLSDEIDDRTEGRKAGFGSVPVTVTIGASTWTTSIFPSRQQGAFILPVKQQIRRAEGIGAGDVVTVALTVVHTGM